LRIGNLVNFYGGKRQGFITTISHPKTVVIFTYTSYIGMFGNMSMQQGCESHSVKINAIEPIPLTEEWLIKFGFERESGESYWVISELEIQSVPKIGGGEMLMMPNARYAKEIKYLHQLQNLYFALTGEELKTSN